MSNVVPIADDKKAVFYQALLALHGDIETMKRDETNPFFKSKYVSLPKMIRILKPTLQKHGFILSQPTDVANTQQGIVNVVFSSIVHAETGISETAKLAITSDLIKGKSGPDMQGLGGAVTYARRYTLSALLGLEEADDDGNAVSGKVSKAAVKAKDAF
jgi:hypothetical protein